MKAPRAYISGPLQAAADLAAARRFYEQLAEVCTRVGVIPYLPHQQTDPELHIEASPLAVFRRDRRAIGQCDLLVADIGRPSSGVGAELGLAVSSRIPIVAVHRRAEKPSRFLLGMLEDYDAATVIPFDSDAGLAEALTAALSRIGAVPSRA